jgi:colicin import membrane protein
MNALAVSPFAPRRNPNLVAGMLALGVHALFVLLLVFGVSWQTQRPAPVMVDIWQSLPTPPPAPAPRRAMIEKPKFKEPPLPSRRDADIALEKKKAETERLKKQHAAQVAEEKAKADAAREKLQAEDRKRALLRQMEADDLKQRIATETTANQARLEKLTEAQARQAEAQVKQAEAQAKQAAAQARQAEALQAETAGTVGQYRDMISAKVRSNTRVPDNLKGNPEVRCLVKVLPTGEVQSVRVTQSSGNVAYDEAVVRAIEKSSPLPLPSDRQARAAFVPELSFVHRPKE